MRTNLSNSSLQIKNWLIYTMLIIGSVYLTGCKSSKRAVVERDRVELAKGNDKKSVKGIRRKIIEEAMKWEGTPYRYGGSEKKKGTDCSGLVVSVYNDVADIKLPRTSRQQSEYCQKISLSKAQPGDLVFFATGKDKNVISHVGILLDDNRFIHSSTKKGVIISELNTPYYERTFIMSGKVPGL